MRVVWLGLMGSLAGAGCSRPAAQRTTEPVHASTAPSETRVESASTIRMSSDVDGIDLLVHCDRAIPRSGYSAETDSSVPLDSAYARERELDQGLVTMMNSQRRTKAFLVPQERIRSAIEIRYDMDVYDKMDLLLMTAGDLIVIHTSTADAGIFTTSDVWQLPAASRLSSLPQPLRQFAQSGLDACGSAKSLP